MYIQQVETFIRVADCGSFGKAAESLFISTPAVVQQINLFEERCGVTVFERSNRGVSLTPAGQSLYEDAKQIIALSDQALKKAQQIEEASQRTIRIGTSPIFRTRVLIDVMTAVREDGLDFQFEIPNLIADLSQMNLDILGDTCDLLEALYCDIAWKDRWQFLELFQTPIRVAVSHSHPLASKDQLTLTDLLPYTIVMLRPGAVSQLDALRQDILDLDPEATFYDVPTIGQDTFALTEMQGYVFISEQIFEDNHPNLVSIPLDTPHTLPYGLIYALEPSPATQDLLDYIADDKASLVQHWV